jgi:hypothetical protein
MPAEITTGNRFLKLAHSARTAAPGSSEGFYQGRLGRAQLRRSDERFQQAATVKYLRAL